MSIREQIAVLEELSGIDGDLRRVDEQLDKHNKGLSGMRSEVQGLEDRLRADRETLTQMDKTRTELQGEVRQMSQQIERSREKLQRSRNERETNAAQREIEELRKLVRDREEELQRLNAAADQAKTAINEADGKRSALTGELEGTQAGIVTSISELDAERQQRLEQRAAVAAKLPPTLLRRYESIRTRRPTAIARTHDGTCLGCHVSVPPAMFQKMRNQDQFEQCPNCRRLLYYVPLDGSSIPPESSRS